MSNDDGNIMEKEKKIEKKRKICILALRVNFICKYHLNIFSFLKRQMEPIQRNLIQHKQEVDKDLITFLFIENGRCNMLG